MADLLQVADWFAADPLRRRVRGDQLGMLGLKRAQLVEERVVLVVADLGIVENVIAIAVMVELTAQLGDTCLHVVPPACAQSSVTSRAAGSISRARS